MASIPAGCRPSLACAYPALHRAAVRAGDGNRRNASARTRGGLRRLDGWHRAGALMTFARQVLGTAMREGRADEVATVYRDAHSAGRCARLRSCRATDPASNLTVSAAAHGELATYAGKEARHSTRHCERHQD